VALSMAVLHSSVQRCECGGLNKLHSDFWKWFANDEQLSGSQAIMSERLQHDTRIESSPETSEMHLTMQWQGTTLGLRTVLLCTGSASVTRWAPRHHPCVMALKQGTQLARGGSSESLSQLATEYGNPTVKYTQKVMSISNWLCHIGFVD